MGEKLNEEFISSYLDDCLCREVLEGYQKDCCELSANFWMSKLKISKTSKINDDTICMAEKVSTQISEIQVDSDDDDDDDLKPIESLDVPDQNQATKIVIFVTFWRNCLN